jgi:hypothetical protein
MFTFSFSLQPFNNFKWGPFWTSFWNTQYIAWLFFLPFLALWFRDWFILGDWAAIVLIGFIAGIDQD